MICPYCKREFHKPPAVSRRDSTILCCSRCGTREALEDIGVLSPEKIEKILSLMYDDITEVEEP